MDATKCQVEAYGDRDVYIAGPLFTPGERAYLERIDTLCRDFGITTYLPHRDGGFGPPDGDTTGEVFASDVQMLEHSRRVIAVLNGPDVDSGTAWELGFAYARGKQLLGIREDWRGGQVNLMISASLGIVSSLAEVREVVQTWSSPG